MNKTEEIFGSLVFDDRVMRERLPKPIYRALKRTIEEGKSLDKSISDCVANAIKGSYPFYSLVPAHDRYHGGKA